MTPLSRNLSAEAFCATQHRNLAEENLREFLRSPELLDAGRRFADEVWEPFLDLVGGAAMTSGYRCQALNAAVGGSRPPLGLLSAHCFARAGDCVPGESLLEAMDLLRLSSIRFDKAIMEGVGSARWLHLQIRKDGATPRRLLLVTYGDRNPNGSLVFARFDPQDPRAQVFA